MNNNLILKEKTTKENRIWVRIAAACNEKCLFCLDADAQNGKLIDQTIIQDEITSGYKAGVYNRIIISGWEASINPRFSDYISYAKSIGYDRIQTVTNGNMFSRPDFCKKVFDAWLQEVTFSFHWHTKKLHDYLTATPWSFEKALAWLIHIRKYYPNIIINIDMVVNKLNVEYLPKMVQFFMRLWVYEFDILQIIPFWRGFSEYKDILFYKIEDYIKPLHETWRLSRIPGMYMWTNRFPAEAFEWFEDLIQDPRKIKSEVMGEALEDFQKFIASSWNHKPHCYGEACNVCFLKQYCHGYIKNQNIQLPPGDKYILADDGWEPRRNNTYIVLRWEEFPSKVYEKYGDTGEQFLQKIQDLSLSPGQKLVNIPYCMRKDNNEGLYEYSSDLSKEKLVWNYTKNYIMDLYRKKSIQCTKCKYNHSCEWVHINFIRSYWFNIFSPITS